MPLTKTYKYKVLEYDDKGVIYPSDKVFVLDTPNWINLSPRMTPDSLLLIFFKQMFETISSTSGYIAQYDTVIFPPEKIEIKWRNPTWKLIRIKEDKDE